MPLPTKRFTLTKLVAAAGASLALLALPGTAAAAGPVCAPKTSLPVFAPFGDLRDFYLAPGGNFEGSISWSKSGPATVVAGNEPWLLAPAPLQTSARLANGARITSPKLCVSELEPDMRFFAKYNGGGQLDVTVRVYDADGDVTNTSSGSISPSDHATWRPSRDVHLNTAHFTNGDTGYIDIAFRSQGDWQVDDVFIDPYRY